MEMGNNGSESESLDSMEEDSGPGEIDVYEVAADFDDSDDDNLNPGVMDQW